MAGITSELKLFLGGKETLEKGLPDFAPSLCACASPSGENSAPPLQPALPSLSILREFSSSNHAKLEDKLQRGE